MIPLEETKKFVKLLQRKDDGRHGAFTKFISTKHSSTAGTLQMLWDKKSFKLLPK